MSSRWTDLLAGKLEELKKKAPPAPALESSSVFGEAATLLQSLKRNIEALKCDEIIELILEKSLNIVSIFDRSGPSSVFGFASQGVPVDLEWRRASAEKSMLLETKKLFIRDIQKQLADLLNRASLNRRYRPFVSKLALKVVREFGRLILREAFDVASKAASKEREEGKVEELDADVASALESTKERARGGGNDFDIAGSLDADVILSTVVDFAISELTKALETLLVDEAKRIAEEYALELLQNEVKEICKKAGVPYVVLPNPTILYVLMETVLDAQEDMLGCLRDVSFIEADKEAIKSASVAQTKKMYDESIGSSVDQFKKRYGLPKSSLSKIKTFGEDLTRKQTLLLVEEAFACAEEVSMGSTDGGGGGGGGGGELTFVDVQDIFSYDDVATSLMVYTQERAIICVQALLAEEKIRMIEAFKEMLMKQAMNPSQWAELLSIKMDEVKEKVASAVLVLDRFDNTTALTDKLSLIKKIKEDIRKVNCNEVIDLILKKSLRLISIFSGDEDSDDSNVGPSSVFALASCAASPSVPEDLDRCRASAKTLAYLQARQLFNREIRSLLGSLLSRAGVNRRYRPILATFALKVIKELGSSIVDDAFDVSAKERLDNALDIMGALDANIILSKIIDFAIDEFKKILEKLLTEEAQRIFEEQVLRKIAAQVEEAGNKTGLVPDILLPNPAVLYELMEIIIDAQENMLASLKDAKFESIVVKARLKEDVDTTPRRSRRTSSGMLKMKKQDFRGELISAGRRSTMSPMRKADGLFKMREVKEEKEAVISTRRVRTTDAAQERGDELQQTVGSALFNSNALDREAIEKAATLRTKNIYDVSISLNVQQLMNYHRIPKRYGRSVNTFGLDLTRELTELLLRHAFSCAGDLPGGNFADIQDSFAYDDVTTAFMAYTQDHVVPYVKEFAEAEEKRIRAVFAEKIEQKGMNRLAKAVPPNLRPYLPAIMRRLRLYGDLRDWPPKRVLIVLLRPLLRGAGTRKAESWTLESEIWDGVEFDETTSDAELGFQVRSLQLPSCDLLGSIDRVVQEVVGPRLVKLDLSNNRIRFDLTHFNGALSLEFLDLSFTLVHGSIESLDKCTKLEHLALTKPWSTRNKSMKNLEHPRLASTTVVGDIETLSNFPGLKILMLNSTSVSGDVSAMRNLSRLEQVQLSCTFVHGDVENFKACLESLVSVRLFKTKIEGDPSIFAKRDHLENLNSPNPDNPEWQNGTRVFREWFPHVKTYIAPIDRRLHLSGVSPKSSQDGILIYSEQEIDTGEDAFQNANREIDGKTRLVAKKIGRRKTIPMPSKRTHFFKWEWKSRKQPALELTRDHRAFTEEQVYSENEAGHEFFEHPHAQGTANPVASSDEP